MKEKFTIEDVLTLSDNEILDISNFLKITWSEWNNINHIKTARDSYIRYNLKHNSLVQITEKLNGNQMLEFIKKYYQLDMSYSDDVGWIILLYEHHHFSHEVDFESYHINDSYNAENNELMDLLFDTIKWVFQNKK